MSTPEPAQQQPHLVPLTPAPQQHHQSGAGGYAITSMVLGIVAVVIGVPVINFLIAVGAIVFGIIAIKRKQSFGMALTGLITGGIAAIAGLLMVAFFAVLLTNTDVQQWFSDDSTGSSSYEIPQPDEKTYPRGQTADFGDYTVTAGTIEKVGTITTLRPRDGMQFVVVPLTLTNTSDDTIYTSAYQFALNYGEDDESSYPITVARREPRLPVGDLATGATVTGNLVYEIPTDATRLRLSAYDESTDRTYSDGELIYYLTLE